MAQHGLARRVLVVSAVVVGLILAASATVVLTVNQLRDTQARRDAEVEAARIEAMLLTDYVDEETGLRGYLLTGETSFLAPYDEAGRSIPQLTEDLRQTWTSLQAPAAMVDRLDDAHTGWVAYAQEQIDLVTAGEQQRATTTSSTVEGRRLFDEIRDAERSVSGWLAASADRTGARLADLESRLTAFVAATLGLLLAVVVAGCTVLWRAVARPLARLAAATRVVAAGDLSAVLPATGAPEMRSLAADVTAMRDRLAADLHGTRQALEALEQTGPAVSALRAALQSTGGEVAGVAVAGRLDSAEGVLAGDWYDSVELSPTRLGVVVGDVAGHGPGSAVFALRLKHSLLAALRADRSPGEAVTAVCEDLAGVDGGRFATAFVAVLDTVEWSLTYVNAGHPPALVGQRSAADGWAELEPTGPLLSSAVIGRSWRTERIAFGPGEVLVVYTDGVTESRDASGAEFGTDGLRRAVTATDDPARLVDAVAAASMRFGSNRPRRDDHTVVCVRRTRAGRPVPTG